jgi:hypothetical protein
MENITAVSNLKEYFRDSVEQAMDRQQVDADDQTACYVVNLLTLFARSEAFFDQSENGPELRPVALVLADAVDAGADGLTSKLVGIDYYVRMGGAAYGTLADNIRGSIRGRAIGNVFTELAEKFSAFVDVLSDIRDAAGTSHTDVLRLYESWQQTGSRRAANILRSLGIEPTQAPGTATIN